MRSRVRPVRAAPISPRRALPTGWNGWLRRRVRASITAGYLWEVGMLISPAMAHGFGGAGGTAVGPLILLAVAIVFVLVYVGRRKWRGRKLRRDGSGSGGQAN